MDSTTTSLDTTQVLCPRVLIVEDDANLGCSLARLLKASGATVTVVGTVQAAFAELFQVPKWSAVIVDVQLPDGSGLDVLSRLRATDRNTYALVLTGYLENSLVNESFKLDAAYLVKPLEAELLREFLSRICGVPRERSPTGADSDRCLPSDTQVPSDLPEDLRQLIGDVLNAAEALGAAHTEHAFRVALLARAASGRIHLGRSVTVACARAVKISRPSFQEYIAVTSHWKPSELRTLLGLRDRHGRAVTLSHLLQVVRAPGALRSQLEQVIREATDLRLLHALVEDYEKALNSSPPGS